MRPASRSSRPRARCCRRFRPRPASRASFATQFGSRRRLAVTATRASASIGVNADHADLPGRPRLGAGAPVQGIARPGAHRGRRDAATRCGRRSTAAWTQYVAARESVSANRELVSAAQLALNGVIEERNVGQRTTLDVLNAQADVINAQINLASVRARRGRGAATPSCRRSGACRPPSSACSVTSISPKEHYDAVKDKWFGTAHARRPLITHSSNAVIGQLPVVEIR